MARLLTGHPLNEQCGTANHQQFALASGSIAWSGGAGVLIGYLASPAVLQLTGHMCWHDEGFCARTPAHLVDHDQVLVLIHDVQRYGLRNGLSDVVKQHHL
jgi:hypothetical protein